MKSRLSSVTGFFLIRESGWVIEGARLGYSGNLKKSGFSIIQVISSTVYVFSSTKKKI